MKQTVGVIDYGYAGNIFNIKKALTKIDSALKINVITKPKELLNADKLIFPGVGAFADAMDGISDLKAGLTKAAKTKPILGICLGMQILGEKGFEFQEADGFNFVQGEVMQMRVNLPVPHLGWAKLEQLKPTKILKNINPNDNFYFMHSYELYNFRDVVAVAAYGRHRFVAVIEKDNIFGVQFHPEKSRQAGLTVFKNFLNI